MAINKKSTNNKLWRGCVEKGSLLHCWWECKLVQSLWKIVWRFFKKLKIELSYDPAPHSWAFSSGKDENSNLKRYMYPKVHSSIIYNNQDMKTTQVPINR